MSTIRFIGRDAGMYITYFIGRDAGMRSIRFIGKAAGRYITWSIGRDAGTYITWFINISESEASQSQESPDHTAGKEVVPGTVGSAARNLCRRQDVAG